MTDHPAAGGAKDRAPGANPGPARGARHPRRTPHARRAAAGLAAAAALLAAAVAIAGDGEALVVGERVRIRAAASEARSLTGAIVALDEASITLRTPARPEPVRIARAQLTSLERSAGRGSRVPGAALGVIVGAVVGLAVTSRSGGTHLQSADDAAVALAALLGGGVGAAVPPREAWRAVPLGTHRVSLVARPDLGVGVGLRLAF